MSEYFMLTLSPPTPSLSLSPLTMERDKVGRPTEGESHGVSYPPAVVVYMVDPFSYEDETSSSLSLALLLCYLDMLQALPAHLRHAVSVQVHTHTLSPSLCLSLSVYLCQSLSVSIYLCPVCLCLSLSLSLPQLRSEEHTSELQSR